MSWDRDALLDFLRARGIASQEATHHAVYTMAESAALNLPVLGARCKNLLVQDRRAIHRFLVVSAPDAAIDLAALGHLMDVGRLSLAPPEDMMQLLGVSPGAASPFALVADKDRLAVRLLFDEGLRREPVFLFHPMVNTSTVAIDAEEFRRFVAATGHAIEYVSMPRRDRP